MAMIIPMQWKRAHPAPCPQARLFSKSVSVKVMGVPWQRAATTRALCVRYGPSGGMRG